MKKLLLLAVLALGVVACDKNELGMDMDGSSINPIEVKVDDSFARNTMLDILFGGIADAAPVVENQKGQASTAKNNNDYIAAYIFISDTKNYIVLVDENNDDLCFGEQAVSIAYVSNSDGNGFATIEDGDENVTKTLGSGYSDLFSADLNEITNLDFNAAQLIVATVQFDADNSATFSN